jgi:hypothetical protein
VLNIKNQEALELKLEQLKYQLEIFENQVTESKPKFWFISKFADINNKKQDILTKQRANLKQEISAFENIKELKEKKQFLLDNNPSIWDICWPYFDIITSYFYEYPTIILIIILVAINLYFFFIKNKEEIIKFRNIPIIKLILTNFIISSLFLIPIKLLFDTTFLVRLFLLFCFLFIACKFNLRQKIKIPIGWLLEKFLGYEFINQRFAAEGKRNHFKNQLEKINYNSKIYKIWFEVFWVFRKIFQKIYTYLNAIILYCDTNLFLYIILYYNLFFFIIFLNQGVVLSYIGLFMISSRLLVYINENNYGEFIKSLTEDNNNLELYEKKLKLTKKKYNDIYILEYTKFSNKK